MLLPDADDDDDDDAEAEAVKSCLSAFSMYMAMHLASGILPGGVAFPPPLSDKSEPDADVVVAELGVSDRRCSFK